MAEERYLGYLIYEYVNDYETREKIIASLGFCPKHAWQMGLMENEIDGDATGNSIIYEHLVKVVLSPLLQYEKEYKAIKNNNGTQIVKWLKGLWKQPIDHPNEPFETMIRSTCRVCQIGEDNEKNYLKWILEDFSQTESELRDKYLLSDGLCFQHFRQALLIQTTAVESGVQFLVQQMLETLPKLAHDLREYTDKHAFDRHTEAMTPDERISWIRAIRFFAGNEGNILLEDLRGIPSDDRVHNNKKGKYD